MTAIPLITSPIPAFQMMDTLNALIGSINTAVNVNLVEQAPALPWLPSAFYGLPKGATPGTLLSVTATLYAYPLFIPGNVPVKTISLYSSTGQTGGAGHVGIYSDVSGAPNALVTGSDSGALAATANTTAATATYATPITLTRGWYWLASIFTASGTFPTVGSVATGYANELPAQQGFDTIAHAVATSAQAPTGVTAAGTYGALPASFPTPAVQLNAGIPLVLLGT